MGTCRSRIVTYCFIVAGCCSRSHYTTPKFRFPLVLGLSEELWSEYSSNSFAPFLSNHTYSYKPCQYDMVMRVRYIQIWPGFTVPCTKWYIFKELNLIRIFDNSISCPLFTSFIPVLKLPAFRFKRGYNTSTLNSFWI